MISYCKRNDNLVCTTYANAQNDNESQLDEFYNDGIGISSSDYVGSLVEENPSKEQRNVVQTQQQSVLVDDTKAYVH